MTKACLEGGDNSYKGGGTYYITFLAGSSYCSKEKYSKLALDPCLPC